MKGDVKKVSIGSKSAFKIPKTAAIVALPKLSISISNGNLEIINKADSSN